MHHQGRQGQGSQWSHLNALWWKRNSQHWHTGYDIVIFLPYNYYGLLCSQQLPATGQVDQGSSTG